MLNGLLDFLPAEYNMPIYNYECGHCGHKEEQFKSRQSERHDAFCSKCKQKTTLIPSITNFKLTGTGWYVTDYNNKYIDKKAKDND